MIRLICLLIGYCFGMIQWAYIIGKKHGIDIREHGSGNSGTTNAMRVMGTKTGIIVFFLDMFKCVIAIALVTCLFKNRCPELIWPLKMYTFLGCVLGHDYPFYMQFRGGKGVAVLAGFVFSFHWTFAPVAAIMFLGPFLITHYVSLGSLLMYGGVLIQMVISGQCGLFSPTSPSGLMEMYIIQAVLTGMAWYRHRANIQRLLSGTESKTYLSHKTNEDIR